MKKKLLGYYDYTVILTYCGMLFAFLGLLQALGQDYWNAVLCLMLAGVCDMFDGAVASTKDRNESEKRFGIQIDSLSDLISFGVLPAVFTYMISGKNAFVGLAAALFVLCALIRLAYFNVLEEERQRQTTESRKSYLGVPVTAIAVCLPAVYLLYDHRICKSILCFPILLIFMGIAYLLPVEIKKPGIIGKAGIIILGILIKTIWKRAEMVVLALALAVFSLLTACGGNKENNTVSDKQVKQGVFREKEKTEQVSGVIAGESNVAAMAFYDNILYMVVNAYPEGGHTVVLHAWDKAGNKISEATVYEIASGEAGPDAGIMPLAADGNDTEVKTSSVTANAYDFRITPQGNVLYTLNESGTDENGETVDRNYLKGVDKTGMELFSLDIKSLTEGEEAVAVQSVVFSPDNTFYLLTGQKIFEVDTAGNIVNKYDPPEGYKDLYNPAFYYKGEPVFTIWNYEGETSTVKSLIFDFKTGRVKKELDIPQNILNQYSVYPGMESGYDLILSNSTGLYGYNPGAAEPVPIMNYVASNLPISGFENVCFLNGKEFVCNYYDNVENKNRIAWMEHVEPSSIPDRQVMTLAMFGSDINMLRKIINFNKSSQKYKILVTDYSTYATTEDYNAGIIVLNNEIAAGRVPDIIYNTGGFDFRNYAEKGMLADFYELIKTDGEIKLEDYCGNVLKAFETKGKLYELAHDFYVETMVGKKSIFGEDTSLTWEKMNQILAQYPDASAFQNTTTRDSVLNWALRYCMDEFVDWQKSTCNFDSAGFRSLLAFASRFPDTIDYDKLYENNDAWIMQEQQFISNASLLNPLTISNMNDIKNFTYGSFLEEVTPVGFPNNRGMGSSICAVGTFGISEKSVHKQAAWEFVRQFILPEQQMVKDSDRYLRYGLPVYKPALLDMASHMTEKPFYIDSESGEKVHYDNTVTINGQDIVVEPATQKEAKKWLDFILSVDKRVNGTADVLLKIVNEEAAAYFNGQKSVEDVTKIIQSRMSIYVSENG